MEGRGKVRKEPDNEKLQMDRRARCERNGRREFGWQRDFHEVSIEFQFQGYFDEKRNNEESKNNFSIIGLSSDRR